MTKDELQKTVRDLMKEWFDDCRRCEGMCGNCEDCRDGATDTIMELADAYKEATPCQP
jgi:hypothetical protein